MDRDSERALDAQTRECILTIWGETWYPVYTIEKLLERPDYDPGGRQVIQGVMLRLEWATRPTDQTWVARPGTRKTVLEMGWF